MDISDDRPEAEELDPEHAQVRDDSSPELGQQHDEDRDPLDIAIMLEHERVDEDESIGTEEDGWIRRRLSKTTKSLRQ